MFAYQFDCRTEEFEFGVLKQLVGRCMYEVMFSNVTRFADDGVGLDFVFIISVGWKFIAPDCLFGGCGLYVLSTYVF